MEHQKTMRFEKGNLFIEIEKDNQLIFIRNGEIGEKGNEETKSFKSFEEVETFFNNEISRLISENYIEIKCETDTNSILAGEIAEDLKLGIDLILKALNGNFEPLFEFVKSAFNIILLDTKVMEYIKSTLNMRKINGPLSFAGFRESFKYKFSFDKLWGIGSQEKMFPAIQVASETYGHYFFMMLETGNVIAMHHDDLSYNAEEPWTTSEEDEDKFCSLLEADFFLCNIQQLICFQKETEQIEDFEIEAVATINALTSCFNISMENLMELSTSIPFAFLNLDKQLISNLISSKKSFKQLKTNAAEIIDLDLSNLNLRELPNEISKCTSLEFIDLSNNSALDFQKTFNSLTALKKLSIIKINNNNLTDLPSGIDQLKQVIKISLANNSIAEIGENWKNLSHLQVIDLKENSISDLLKDLIQRYLPNTEIITKNRERKLLKSFDDIFEQIHKDLPNLQEYEKVETIWFNNAKKVEINLEEFRNLKHLKLSGYDQALEELPANIGQLIKLETLSISIQDKLNFEETVQVASNLNGLKRLELF